ncbi:hypothetical protein B0T22DRAFT_272726 [Podospora appendiculata]|uniref:EKC/KEOPS complex subunit GON7 n=1 Tax=Podospora appendiculata TaxID=314037 RepID=A0AAE1C9J2_9PEZI|nr:hypothetical protein B0T22DRAFT_272726 [Podospora appendiculata]
MASETPHATTTLTAVYSAGSSGNEAFTLSHAISPIAGSSETATVQDKSRYLRDLRAAVVTTQEQVNKELTARMEEDKAKAAAVAGVSSSSARKGKGGVVVDDVEEEEHYGEEAQEDED